MRKLIIGMILAGGKDTAIARAVSNKRLTVTRQAIGAFRRRHADTLEPEEARMQREAADYAIANKVNRIATNDLLKNLLLTVRDERAAGRTGIGTGLVVMREKALGSGDNMTIVEEYEIDPAIVTLIDKLHNSTANELGQLPKGRTLDLSDRRTYVLQVVTNGNSVPLG